jgi:hypothetical protein
MVSVIVLVVDACHRSQQARGPPPPLYSPSIGKPTTMIALANTASTDPDHKQYFAAIVNMPNHHR